MWWRMLLDEATESSDDDLGEWGMEMVILKVVEVIDITSLLALVVSTITGCSKTSLSIGLKSTETYYMIAR
jgi:hypothetical protein